MKDKNKMKISICMATYNGIRYLEKQINSILMQMSDNDELLIVDDASTDGTYELLMTFLDSRIRIIKNTINLGHVQSFAKAIELARGDYIIMADQDDIWIEGRVSVISNALESGAALVSTNSKFIDENDVSIGALHQDLRVEDSDRYASNILRIFIGKAFYYGCTMAFRQELRRLVLPIPQYVESHDLWIAMAGNIFRSNLHLAEYTLLRRVHGANASVVSRFIISKLKSRIIFLISLIHIFIRLLFLRYRIPPKS